MFILDHNLLENKTVKVKSYLIRYHEGSNGYVMLDERANRGLT